MQTYGEQWVETPDHILECPGGRPPHGVDGALAQKTQTYVSVLWDVWVPYPGLTFHLRGLSVNRKTDTQSDTQLDTTRACQWICCSYYQNIVLFGHIDGEPKPSSGPKALVSRRSDAEIKSEQLVGVGKHHITRVRHLSLHLLHLWEPIQDKQWLAHDMNGSVDTPFSRRVSLINGLFRWLLFSSDCFSLIFCDNLIIILKANHNYFTNSERKTIKKTYFYYYL
jgi:hypothetical protein